MGDEHRSISAEESGLRDEVRKAYSTAARTPEVQAPFPVGISFALSLGYRLEELDTAPAAAAVFTGVSCMPALIRQNPPCPPVRRCLDLGCGAGLDAILTARTFPGAQVTAVDFSSDMLAQAQTARQQAKTETVALCQASAEALPFPDASFDLATVNGIFNLNPWRNAIFRELGRVLRPGGRLYAAELIVADGHADAVPRTAANWFS